MKCIHIIIAAAHFVICIAFSPIFGINGKLALHSRFQTIPHTVQSTILRTSGIGSNGLSGTNPPPPSINAGSYGTSREYSSRNSRKLVLLAVMLPSISNNTTNEITKRNQPLSLVSFKDWWKKALFGPSGIFVLATPYLVNKVKQIVVSAPAVTERLSQYANPSISLMAATLVLKTPVGVLLTHRLLAVSMVIGAFYMWKDSHASRDRWGPLSPQQDAYAVITGYVTQPKTCTFLVSL